MTRFQFSEDLYESFYPVISQDRNILTSPENHQHTPLKIQETLTRVGVSSQILEFDFHGYQGRNVWIEPPIPDDPFVLIMAHHDTVPDCPGVDDNGSGLMVVIQLINWYHEYMDELSNLFNLGFVFTDFEEGDPRNFIHLPKFIQQEDEIDSYGDIRTHDDWKRLVDFLNETVKDRSSYVGARKFVEFLAQRDQLDKVDVVINFETVGYTSETQKQIPNVPIELDKGDFLSIAINAEATSWIQKLEQMDHHLKVIYLPIPHQGRPVPDSRRSDHSVFWDLGIDGMFCTDTANFRNPNYHKSTDTEINRDFIRDICSYFADFLRL